MKRVAILAARRSAIGSFGGIFKDFGAVALGVEVLKAAMTDSGLAPDDVGEVILGNVLSANLGENVARQVAVGAGVPFHVPSYAVNMLCGSGLKAVALGAAAIQMGEAEVVAAGGTENMSQTPYAVPGARYGARMGNAELVDLLLRDGLNDAFEGYHMGATAEILADAWQISRAEMDDFAARSQNRAEEAVRRGAFSDEIVPINVPQKKGDPCRASADEYPRKGVTTQSLAGLKPAFRKDGRVTVGNSSGINDGAAFVILASEEKVRALGRKPLAWVSAAASAALEPSHMGFGPVPATQKVLAKAGWRLDEIDRVELNEAFAAQALAVLKGFAAQICPVDEKRLNVNGGAIALGHPLGASGARILVTLLHEMRRNGCAKGLATLCVGGGQGMSMLVQRE
jgi:acetyl-CoA C-acetyltransferase